MVGISIALLEYGNQRVEVIHIGLSNFEKSHRQ